MERRKESRTIFDSMILPFMGSSAQHHSFFQYLLIDISPGGIKIAIPKWLVQRDRPKVAERINLHVPFRFGKTYYQKGHVAWTSWDETGNAQACGVQIEKTGTSFFPIFFSLQSCHIRVDMENVDSVGNLLKRILKDSSLLKKGILIYLKHLVPFFSRITSFPQQDYPQLIELVFDNIRAQIEKSSERLEALYLTATKEKWSSDDVPKKLDLEDLRSLIESEINVDLLQAALDAEAVGPYLEAIRELEKKCYSNYNTIVMLYIQSLTPVKIPSAP